MVSPDRSPYSAWHSERGRQPGTGVQRKQELEIEREVERWCRITFYIYCMGTGWGSHSQAGDEANPARRDGQ